MGCWTWIWFAMCAAAPSARADTPTFTSASTTLSGPLGDSFRGSQLRYEVKSEFQGGDYYWVRTSLRWGNREQVLFEGMGTAPAQAVRLHLDGAETVVVREPTGNRFADENQVTTTRWSWNERQQRFVKAGSVTTSPYQIGSAAVRQALERGDLASARKHLRAIGCTPNGGHTLLFRRWLAEFFAAAVHRARMEADRARPAAAAAVVLGLVLEPPCKNEF